MAYDVRPLVTIEEKRRLLPRAHDERWLLFLEHDPKTEVITLQQTQKGFAVGERRKLDP